MWSIVAIVALLIVAWIAWDFYSCWRKSSSKGIQRLWDAGHGSATMVVQQFAAVVTGLALSFDKLAGWVGQLFGDPAASDQAKALINQFVTPEYVGIAVMALIGLTALARARTL